MWCCKRPNVRFWAVAWVCANLVSLWSYGRADAGQGSSKQSTAVGLGPEYDELYPYYMKYCSTTKYHPYRGKGVEGTIAGHGLYYLKGVCKEPSLGPSGLKLCDESSDFADPELGVGISVNKGLKNVNFLVIPGRRLFLGTNLIPDSPLDFESKTVVINELLRAGVFKGVEFHREMMPASLQPQDYEEFIARYVFGSDYAISMARSLYCINVPFNRAAMGSVVTQLNEVNQAHSRSAGTPYRGVLGEGTKADNDYYWNVIYDNCVHPGWNALAKVGLLKPKAVNRPLWRQLWNVPVPANAMLEIHKRANKQEIDVDDYYKDPVKRHAFQQYRWVGEQAGTLVEVIKLYGPNTIYKSDENMFLFPSVCEPRHLMFHHACSRPRYSYHGQGWQGFVANFQFFQQKYRHALDKVAARQNSRRYVKAREHSSAAKLTELQEEARRLEVILADQQLDPQLRASQESQLAKVRRQEEQWREADEYVTFVDQFGAYLNEEIKRIDAFWLRILPGNPTGPQAEQA